MATMRNIGKVTSRRTDDYSIYERQAASAHRSARTLLAMVALRLVILTAVAALVAIVVAMAV